MTLSKRTQYGLRALVCLADAYQQGYLQTRELAAREKLPTKFLESIMSALTRGRFLVSKIGATGGYRLARPPEEIRLDEIISRLEGSELLDEHVANPAERPGETAVRFVEMELSGALRDVLNKKTLATLAAQVSHHTGGQMYYI